MSQESSQHDVSEQASQLIQPGDFPFRLKDGDAESPYLIWLRNHSSYLSVGGFTGALGAVAIYIRGIIGNILMLLPLLIPIGVVLGLAHPWLIDEPLVVTRVPLTIAIALVFLFFGLRFGQPQDQRKQSWFMNALASLVVSALLISVLIDFSPRVIEFFRKNELIPTFGLKECAALIVTIAGIAGTVVKVVPRSPSFQRILALGTLCVLGLVLIWIVILRIAFYICYGVPPTGWKLAIPQFCAGVMFTSLAVAAGGVREWSAKVRALIVVLIVTVGGFAVYGLHGYGEYLRHHSDRAMESIGVIVRSLSLVADGVEEIQDQSPLIQRIVAQKRALDAEAKVRVSPQGDFDDLHQLFPNSVLQPDYYTGAQQLLEDVEALKSDDPVEVLQLLDALARVGFAEIENRRQQADGDVLPIVNALLDVWFIQNTSGLLGDVSDAKAILALPMEEIRSWAKSRIALDELKHELLAERLPMSMASDYFSVVANSGQKPNNFIERSSPDAALAGPTVFTAKLLSDDAWLQKKFESAAIAYLLQSAAELESDSIDHIPLEVLSERERKLACGRRIRHIDDFIALVRSAVNGEQDLNPEGILEYCRSTADSMDSDSETRYSRSIDERHIATELLTEFALSPSHPQQHLAEYVMGEIYRPQVPSVFELPGEKIEDKEKLQSAIYGRRPGTGFDKRQYEKILAARLLPASSDLAASTIRRLMFGVRGNFEDLENAGFELFTYSYWPRLALVLTIWVGVCLFCWLFVNPNLTSIHAFYRDRLADAFILCPHGDKVMPEVGVRLSSLCNYADGSAWAPYHLINTAVNMTTKDDKSVRDRNADFFIFSKLFCGGRYTGYIRTEQLESACPEFTTASAMAISAGAASPNMGKYTSSVLTFLLSLLNVRLGHWMPNPSQLQTHTPTENQAGHANFVSCYRTVMHFELTDIAERRMQASDARSEILLERELGTSRAVPTTNNKLLGLAFSGGGIRSAAVNLGIAQILDRSGVLSLADYLSTVSGGGYLGSGMSTFMRASATSEAAAGKVSPNVLNDATWRRLKWRPPFWLFLNEMVRYLRINARWVNLSDGGHIENLGVYELLRRQCEIIIVGDAEEDSKGEFLGLSTLLRLAQIDMGIRIMFADGELEELTDTAIRSPLKEGDSPVRKHFVVGKIYYPRRAHVPNSREETGYMLYIRSSLVGDEDQVIAGYKRSNKAFPHQLTTDQQFDEVQFECYRRLGQKMAEQTLQELGLVADGSPATYDGLFKATSTYNPADLADESNEPQ